MFKRLKYNLLSLLNHRGFLTPGTWRRTLSGVIRSRLGQRRLRNCQMAITTRCNQHCSFCSTTDFKGGQELSLLEYIGIVEQAKVLGAIHFDITGGEPTLRWDMLLLLINYITRKKDCVCSLATNGKILNDNKINELKKAGLISILFDVQSIDPKINDERCQEEFSLGWVLLLTERAQEVGLKVCFNTYFGMDNIEDIKNLADYCDREKIHLLLNLAAPMGRMKGKDVRLTDWEKQYYQFLYSHPYARSDTTYNYRGLNLCPGGIEKIYITPYGDILTCTFGQISWGNVREEPLRVIYDRMGKESMIRARSICKHTFWPEYREKYITPFIDRAELPASWKEVK